MGSPKKKSETLELELQNSYEPWVLEIEPRSSERVTNTLNHEAISSALCLIIYKGI